MDKLEIAVRLLSGLLASYPPEMDILKEEDEAQKEICQDVLFFADNFIEIYKELGYAEEEDTRPASFSKEENLANGASIEAIQYTKNNEAIELLKKVSYTFHEGEKYDHPAYFSDIVNEIDVWLASKKGE